MRHIITTAVGFAFLFTSAFALAQQPVPPAMVEKAPVIGPPAIQKFPSQRLFFVTGTGSQKTMADAVKKLMPGLTSAAKDAGIVVAGPTVIVYHNITPNPEAPIDFELGFFCEEGTKESGEAQISTLKPVTCATMNFTGNMADIAKAYESLFGAIFASGKMPTAEIRQLILYFENEQSENNLSQIQVVLQ